MKTWQVSICGVKFFIEAETKEEAKRGVVERHPWLEGKRLTAKEVKKELCGWDLIESQGCSKFD